MGAFQAQLERWASLTPTTVRSGRMSEVPPSWLVPRVAAFLGLTGLLWWGNYAMFWNQKPVTFDPEFQAEAKRIGNVAQRVNGPPVFLNPFRNRIPGNVTGPEDLQKESE
ncbi:hypothetical protein DUNSADRAFT_12811 [Dunaliella salina]|uniref:Uncharacterized protein n=1 Tax=Dunaliella salina TaxID=3046 RepID=A0ABQ7GAI5_DUNSA|nr:hypothetical protein DUNSADRAFT_12811 [Dunaliella salina]|eukprot:KAF5831620.1 hypothetical protein DUNSADRAFT_12811 [Dunaliella salina]